MVTFKETILEGKTYLQISDESTKETTSLVVHRPLDKGIAPARPELGREDFEGGSWTKKLFVGQGNSVERHILQSRNHSSSTEVVSFQTLKRRIASREASWGEELVLSGNFTYQKGYWEWTEDILTRCPKTLANASIYNAVYASLYTYDHIGGVARAFFENWNSSTNTLFTAVGELSISLWDLHTFSGLPIVGDFFDEVIPSAHELTGSIRGKQRYLPRTCEYLFHAFHLTYQRCGAERVPIADWISFWCKRPRKYTAPPDRKECKPKRSTRTYNPTGDLPRVSPFTPEERRMFASLHIPPHLLEETYLAAFLSCWLCLFVLPSHAVGYIRPRVFKMACTMAEGHQVGLAIPVLSNIYRGLNVIAASETPGDANASFPFHYVCGWMAFYFSTHYPAPKDLKGPRMVKYSGEGGARYYTPKEIERRIQTGVVMWSSNKLQPEGTFCFTDNEKGALADTSYFISLRSSFLPMRLANNINIEPYNPHRFARQFGYCQDIPGVAMRDLRCSTLDEGFRHWLLCVVTRTYQRATFSNHEIRFCTTKSYDKWLEGSYAKYVKETCPSLPSPEENVVAHESVETPLDLPPNSFHGKGKELRFFKDKGVMPSSFGVTPQMSSSGKRSRSLSVEEVDGDTDRNFKHVRSRERTVTSEPHIQGVQVNELERPGSFCGDSGDVVDKRSDGISSALNFVEDLARLPRPHTPLTCTDPGASVFQGVNFVDEMARSFINATWSKLRDRLLAKPLGEVLTMEDEVKKALECMKNLTRLSLSSLDKKLHSFFRSVHSFHDAELKSSRQMSKESCTKALALKRSSYNGHQNEIERQSKRIQAAVDDLYSVGNKMTDMRRELEDLEKREQAIRADIARDRQTLTDIQIAKSALGKEITSLEETDLMSEEEETRLCQMRADLEKMKYELGVFKIVF